MDMPDLGNCMGVFPHKYACLLISLCGLGTGGVGIAGIVLYAVIEDTIIAHFVKSEDTDPTLKKVVLVTVGLTSLLLVVANTFLFLGATSSSKGFVIVAKWLLFVICFILIIKGMAAPMSCFFMEDTCVIKKISVITMLLGYITVTVFIEIWLYFMIVAHNYEMQL